MPAPVHRVDTHTIRPEPEQIPGTVAQHRITTNCAPVSGISSLNHLPTCSTGSVTHITTNALPVDCVGTA